MAYSKAGMQYKQRCEGENSFEGDCQIMITLIYTMSSSWAARPVHLQVGFHNDYLSSCIS